MALDVLPPPRRAIVRVEPAYRARESDVLRCLWLIVQPHLGSSNAATGHVLRSISDAFVINRTQPPTMKHDER